MVAAVPLLALQLDLDPRAAGAARRALPPVLAGRIPAPVADTALLLVSELVTNVVLHARTPGRLRVWLEAAILRIEVDDLSPALPRLRHYDSTAGTGRGMRLIDSLTQRWGANPTPEGKCVWVELDCSETAEEVVWEFDVDAVTAL